MQASVIARRKSAPIQSYVQDRKLAQIPRLRLSSERGRARAKARALHVHPLARSLLVNELCNLFRTLLIGLYRRPSVALGRRHRRPAHYATFCPVMITNDPSLASNEALQFGR